MIPVNAAGQRLDPYLPKNEKQWARYERLKNAQKLCKAFHLTGNCDLEKCQHSHGPIKAGLRNLVRHLATRHACKQGGKCRVLSCFRGHVCQKPGCVKAGRRLKSCTLPDEMHHMDYEVADWEDQAEIEL